MSRRAYIFLLIVILCDIIVSFRLSGNKAKFGIQNDHQKRKRDVNLHVDTWEKSILPRDSFKEGPRIDPEDKTEDALEILEGTQSPEVITVEELQAKWIDLCIEQKRPNDLDAFSIDKVLPLIIRDDKVVVLVNQSAEAIEQASIGLSKDEKNDDDVEYITEQELQRLWQVKSLQAMGKKVESFNVKDALLLLLDDEDLALVNSEDDTPREVSIAVVSTSSSTGAKKKGKKNDKTAGAVDGESEQDIVIDEDEGVEFFITSEELQRVWNKRAEIRWGMPAAEFNDKDALLLLDDDVDEDDTDYISAVDVDSEEEEALGNWNQYPGKDGQFMREALKRLYEDLEDMTYFRPAWKKTRHILTPDIDTQDFMGDLMWSNTYMTQRVPANWEDPETSEMSETYLSTNTMAWPGEPETDFNKKTPAWEALNLPVGSSQVKDASTVELPEETAAAVGPDGEIDWASYDFSKDAGFEEPAGGDDKIDVDSFFNQIDGGSSETDKLSSSLLAAGLFGGAGEEEDAVAAAAAVADTANEDSLDNGLANQGIVVLDGKGLSSTGSVTSGFKVPADWLAHPQFTNHVGYESWSQYKSEDFARPDDQWWEEDEWTAQSMRHILEVTDLYLTDHVEIADQINERNFWERQMRKVIGGEPAEECDKEPIPIYLTPDKNRGVEYSNELIEMKGKMTLHVAQDPPSVLFANDSFTHNEDMMTTNKIGTIREQYEWEPTVDPKDYKIDSKIVKRIEPLLKFANHIVELKSTKDNVLLFNYKGQMRHIIGIRAMMINIANECFPELKELRLETSRKTDKYDA